MPYVRCPTCGERNYVSTSDYPPVEIGSTWYKQYACSNCSHVHNVSFYDLRREEVAEPKYETSFWYDMRARQHFERINELWNKRRLGELPYSVAKELMQEENKAWDSISDTCHNEADVSRSHVEEVKVDERLEEAGSFLMILGSLGVILLLFIAILLGSLPKMFPVVFIPIAVVVVGRMVWEASRKYEDR